MDLDELYGLDPADFIVARDALAKELKAAGDKEGAATVRALRRPTVVAAAINRVARDRPDDIAALVEATTALRASQAQGAEELRAAGRERRHALQRVAKAATALAGDTHAVTIANTLEAATLDPEVVETLRAGRLEKELAPPSTFDLAFGAGLPPVPEPDRDAERADRERFAAEHAAAVARAEAAVEAARQRVDDAEAHLAAAETALRQLRTR